MISGKKKAGRKKRGKSAPSPKTIQQRILQTKRSPAEFVDTTPKDFVWNM
jgi:hypothetical protein